MECEKIFVKTYLVKESSKIYEEFFKVVMDKSYRYIEVCKDTKMANKQMCLALKITLGL